MQLLYMIIFTIIIVNFSKIKKWFKNLFLFIGYKIKDARAEKEARKKGNLRFKPFGLTMFTGPQGSGKTMALVKYAKDIKAQYPDCKIYSNFDVDVADGRLKNLNDILKIRNGTAGVLFLIDEIQNEFSTASSRNFPESLLSTITQQRKQAIHIAASSQVFTRVSKPLREQCYCVVDCRTFWGRWTRARAYSADEYNSVIDSNSLDKKRKLHVMWKMSFIQTDELRDSYDTYSVVQRLSRAGFSEVINVR